MLACMPLKVYCNCGRVALELKGAPITCLACYCNDCQAGARLIEALDGAPLVQSPDGGTAYAVYRKDRVQNIEGADLLKSIKLKPASPTNRVVASCCNAAMFLNFDDGKHWVDIYRERFGASAPALEMRVCTKFAPDGASVPADVPAYAGYPLPFIVKLIGAKLAMLFVRFTESKQKTGRG
jgi:hypothetical protein